MYISITLLFYSGSQHNTAPTMQPYTGYTPQIQPPQVISFAGIEQFTKDILIKQT